MANKLTPEREKEIREYWKETIEIDEGYSRASKDIDELLAEIDRLREKLAVAVKALDIVTLYDPYQYDDKTCAGFMTVSYANAKEALTKIRGEK